MKINSHKVITFAKSHKKAVIISVSVFAVVLVTCGVFWSISQWDSYGNKTNENFADARTRIDGALSQLTKGKASVSDRLKSISSVQTELSGSANSYCSVSPWIGWQSFIGSNSDKVKECDKKKQLLTQFLDKLKEVTVFLGDEQTLATIISVANQATNQNNQSDKWHLVEGFWRTAITNVSKLPNKGPIKKARSLAVVNLGATADSWKALSAANTAKDRGAFEKAQVDQVKAYSTFSQISDNTKAETTKLLADLSASYSKAF